ncbi:uncharacterized protein Triagg1_9238 [Trichoderma aggressivum f. europaeum]|uniref:Protein kinase domain-containing protein n=1 Tax=Trichoderma aggressivum f. europaeum TaxID=173218 RepID=A0AAE1I6W4_9HYPO|nr:hypothetical protein Triagg1_9238 [Trichoderma aggressivum f. europaeum]
MADDNTGDVVCGRDEAASVASTVSWNTFLSRTNISSLDCALFSEQEISSLHGLDDVIRAVTSLGLRRYRYEEIAREEKVGEGETYLVERCVVANQVLAVKHLKTNRQLDDQTSHRRLRAVILELQILRHRPLRNHPNFPFAFGYGWNMNGGQVIPYLLVQYAPKGTLRQYVKSMSSSIPLRDLQILAGDVASALSALHTCGIVHGDVKLDNVLVVHSWDRPAQALAKLTDFGHALVIDNKSSKHDGIMRYNAPEVHDQDTFPIDRAAMPQCDVWAFGLLVWELCLLGEDHLSYSMRKWPEVEAQMTMQRLNPADARRYAMASVPRRVEYVFIRATLHYTLQEDPTKRMAHLDALPLLTEWNDASISGLESELAFHLDSPSPTYEMFRPENGREIPWKHEEQIFQALERTYSKRHAKDKALMSWQLALCHHVGFGTPRNPASACQYAKIAQDQGHPVAVAFATLLDLDSTGLSEPYVTKISRLLRSTIPPYSLPPVIQACIDGDSEMLKNLLSRQEDPNSSTIDGCTMFHWFFMLKDPEAMAKSLRSMFAGQAPLHSDLPSSCLRKAHDQWPLQLLGTPLGAAISVNSLPAVKALITLGANPLSYVYRKEDFPVGDLRVQWTALHMAAKYHCSEILHYLMSLMPNTSLLALSPLACALPFSTSLERLAMHGAQRQVELDKTVAIIHKVQSLQTALLSGMTAFTQAIDFQDYDVVAALLRAEPKLASRQLASVEDPTVFNLPIHLAAQLAARRDVPEALSILQLINDHTEDLNPETKPSRDYLGMTPLHLAVTGPSNRAANWILEQRIGLLEVEDILGRTALHCCASEANLELLLSRGSTVMHTDKYGMNTLHRACLRGELELVRGLLKHKQPLDLKNNKYGTPLHCAVINGSIDVVVELLEAGAPVNAQDSKGNTPVHVAVRMGRYTILRNLLKRGGNRFIQNFNGRNPENLASIIGAPQGAAALRILQGGQKPNSADYLFSESANFEFLPHWSHTDEALPPKVSCDTNNIALVELSERNASSLDEAPLPDFPWETNDIAQRELSESHILGPSKAPPPGYTWDIDDSTHERLAESSVSSLEETLSPDLARKTDDVAYEEPLEINISCLDGVPPPDFAWDTNDVACETLPESSTSNLDEISTMRDEELPTFPDGRKGKKKLLEKLTNAIVEDMDYFKRGSAKSLDPIRLHAQIIPYLDDSIWQDNKLSAVPVGRILAKTVLGISRAIGRKLPDLVKIERDRVVGMGIDMDDSIDIEMQHEQPISSPSPWKAFFKDELKKWRPFARWPRTHLPPKSIDMDEVTEIFNDEQQPTTSPSTWESEQDLLTKPEPNVIDWILEIVEKTKPSWAMPGRSRRHLENMITCEVARILMTSDTSALGDPLSKAPIPKAHPILEDSSTSEDRRTKLQQNKWRYEREVNQLDGRVDYRREDEYLYLEYHI